MDFKFKDFRETQKLFQSDMASLLGINQSSVSRMELKPSYYLSLPTYKKLCEKFGKENVDAFVVGNENNSVVVAGNTNEGNGTQDNSVTVGDDTTMDIIKMQAKALTDVVKKQSEQADRMMSLLEKLTEKIPL